MQQARSNRSIEARSARARVGRRLSARLLGRRNESGTGMVEMALVMPALLFIIFGILEFGLALNDMSSMRQGVRDAARQGAVANFGPTASCGLDGSAAAATNGVRDLMCLTKAQSGVGDSLKVKVMFVDADLAGSDNYEAGNGMIVCSAHAMESLTGMYAPLINGRSLTAKAAFRIEQEADTGQTGGAEVDPTGQAWSWCAT